MAGFSPPNQFERTVSRQVAPWRAAVPRSRCAPISTLFHGADGADMVPRMDFLPHIEESIGEDIHFKTVSTMETVARIH
jgi:hypothetical protein